MNASPSGLPACRDCTGFFALVSYIPGPLGAYLDDMRAELVPGSSLRSHLTILPPRRLPQPERALVRELQHRTPAMPAVTITIGEIEVFESTSVVYLSIRAGRGEVERMHRSLSGGIFQFDEPFPFHPHITMAQSLPTCDLPRALNFARDRWRECPHNRSFLIDNLTLVQNVNPHRWDNLAEFPLRPSSLLQTA